MPLKEIFKIFLFISILCFVGASNIFRHLPEHDEDVEQNGEDTVDEEPSQEIHETNNGEHGLIRYDNKDILLVAWVPYPIDQWDYAILNISDPAYIKERGRAHMNTFTKESYPDVSIVFACAPKDRDYFYNYNLDVPVIGVDPFQNDHIFLEYIDKIYTIHGFSNLPELWAHFMRHHDAFTPVFGRIYQEFESYLDQWRPRIENEYNYYGNALNSRKIEHPRKREIGSHK